MVTRPLEQARKTAQILVKLGYAPFVLPLLLIQYLYKDLNDDGYDTIIVTSQSVAYMIAGVKWLKVKRVYTVGPATYKALKNCGFNNVIYNDSTASGNVESLIDSLVHDEEARNILYLSGDHIAQDIVSEIPKYITDNARSKSIRQEVVYQSIMVESLSSEDVEYIHSYVSVILLYSPRSARALARLVRKHAIYLNDKIVICISDNTAKAIEGVEVANIVVANRPNEQAIIQALCSLCAR